MAYKDKVIIKNILGEIQIESEFSSFYEEKNYWIIDACQAGDEIGRIILDDIGDEDYICDEDIFSRVELYTDEIKEALIETTIDYIKNNDGVIK